MAIAVDCPACGAAFRVRNGLAGRMIKCPTCTTLVSVPARKAGSNKALLIGLGIGCGVLFLLLVGCVGVVAVVVFNSPDFNARVTKEAYDRLQPGMSLADVEAILGPGQEAVPEDVPAVPESGHPGTGGGGDLTQWRQTAGRRCVYRWKNTWTNTTILVAFTQPPRQGGRLDRALYAVVHGSGFEVHIKGEGFNKTWSQKHG